MKKDAEVAIYMRERRKDVTQEVAAARAGMSVRTARKYEQTGTMPSQLTQPRTHRTRVNPFADVWGWVVEHLERDPALQATTLFALLQQQHPDKFAAVQVRTLQRQIATWRALHGPERAVIFAQVHTPGERAQSDFTHMDDLHITLGGQPFPHLLYHMVLTYSNVEAVRVCPSETFEALAEGIEAALWQFGGVPKQHRTDHLSAAIRRLDASGREDFTERYAALMAHYGMQPTWNNTGVAHENGDVEQSHFRFKDALDQALRVRGSRDFVDRAAYAQFVHELARQRNHTRQSRFAEERKTLAALPKTPLAPCREFHLTVSVFSTIHVLGNTYSVPSRLIGTAITVRVRAEALAVYVGTTHTLTLPRLLGNANHHINYRHIIWSLVRKPGAFAAYRYRDDLFPRLCFRHAYDALVAADPSTADAQYLRVLHLAATTAESEVEAALGLLADAGRVPTLDAVRELVRSPHVAALVPPPVNLAQYDTLLESRRVAQ